MKKNKRHNTIFLPKVYFEVIDFFIDKVFFVDIIQEVRIVH